MNTIYSPTSLRTIMQSSATAESQTLSSNHRHGEPLHIQRTAQSVRSHAHWNAEDIALIAKCLVPNGKHRAEVEAEILLAILTIQATGSGATSEALIDTAVHRHALREETCHP